MTAYHDMQYQQMPLQQQWGAFNPQIAQSLGQGLGFGQRQLSPYEVSDVVRQLIPLLPSIIAQAQQLQPQAAYGLGGGFGAVGGYGQQTRALTQQDVNEVVRQ